VGVVASSDDPALATSSSDQQPSVLNFQLASRLAVAARQMYWLPYFFRQVSAYGARLVFPDAVLIEADRIHALGKKAAAVRIDKPEHTIALVNAKKAASAETIVGDSAPFGSLQADTPDGRITTGYLSHRLAGNC
jgi:hypothetical protein